MKLFALAGLLSLGTPLSALAATVVTPNANAGTLGNGQTTSPLHLYGTGGGQYQQVYSSSLFGAFANLETITDIAFRAKQGPLGNFIGNSVTVSSISIYMSTTSKSDAIGLDATLANNIGANQQLVYSGALTMTASSIGSTNIDYNIQLQNAFTYDKTAGNLLLYFVLPDTAVVSGNGTSGFSQFDTVTDTFPSADGISSAFASSATATVGSNSTTGLVTKFTGTPASLVVPIPIPAAAWTGLSTLACLAGAAAVRRRRMARV